MIYFESTTISGTILHSDAISSNSPVKKILSTEEQNSSKDITDVVKLLELSFFPVPVNNKIPHIEVISLILSSIIYAIQCVIFLEEGKYIKVCRVIFDKY